MPDYKDGKIYAIRSYLTDEVYIGSTCKRLCDRMAHHRWAHKKQIGFCSSSIILERGDAYIELLEEYPCNSKEQLNRKEGEVIRATAKCVNRQVAGRTPGESAKAWREANKEHVAVTNKAWSEANKEHVAVTKKAWREANKEQVAVRMKAWREANKEHVAATHKAWKEANKEHVAAQRKAYYEAKKQSAEPPVHHT